jgi:hypothetical protein
MHITIDSSDSRSIKAIGIASQAGQWLRCRSKDGRKAFGIRSSRDANYVYFVTQTSCTCPDSRWQNRTCKHVNAVRLYCTLVQAGHTNGRSVTKKEGV